MSNSNKNLGVHVCISTLCREYQMLNELCYFLLSESVCPRRVSLLDHLDSSSVDIFLGLGLPIRWFEIGKFLWAPIINSHLSRLPLLSSHNLSRSVRFDMWIQTHVLCTKTTHGTHTTHATHATHSTHSSSTKSHSLAITSVLVLLLELDELVSHMWVDDFSDIIVLWVFFLPLDD